MEYVLIHHGIKGQKWGVMNGPPYPLKPSDYNAAEKKAGWRSSLNVKSGGILKRTKTSSDTKIGENTNSNSNDGGKKKRMSSKTKKIIAVTATVAALGAIGVIAARNPKVRELAAVGKETAKGLMDTGKNLLSTVKSGGSNSNERMYLDSLRKGERVNQEFLKTMREMDAVERRVKIAEKRSIKAQNREIKETAKKWEQAAKKQEAEQKRKSKEFDAELKKMMMENAKRKRNAEKYDKMSSAERAARYGPRRSRYTSSTPYWKK